MTLLVGNPHPQDSTFCLLWLLVAQDKTKEVLLLKLVTSTNIAYLKLKTMKKLVSRLPRLL
jgi:hypothetical protein